MFLTLTAVTVRILANPLANVFQKRLTGGGHNALTVNFMTYLLLCLACLTFAWQTPWASLPAEFWLYATLGGIVGSVGNSFLVLAMRKGDLSILGPVNSYKSIVGMISGAILLGEIPSLMGLTGVVIIVFGSYFVLDTTEEGFSWKLLRNREIQFRLLAMVLTAIEAVFIKKVILYSDTVTSFIVWCWFGAFFALIQQAVMRTHAESEIRHTGGKDWMGFIALAACIGVTQYATNYTFRHMDVGYGLALFQLSTIVSVLLGYRLFHEQSVVKKLVGSAIMIAGSAMVILS